MSKKDYWFIKESRGENIFDVFHSCNLSNRANFYGGPWPLSSFDRICFQCTKEIPEDIWIQLKFLGVREEI